MKFTVQKPPIPKKKSSNGDIFGVDEPNEGD